LLSLLTGQGIELPNTERKKLETKELKVLAARKLMLGDDNVNRLESMKTDIKSTKGALVE
jgi:hypothetical protein